MIRRRQSGFTLIEVIVAFALLAGALTILVGALSNSSRQVRAADDASRATLHAQSLLAQVGVGEILQPGRREGEFDGGALRWELQVEPYVDPARRADAPVDLAAPRLLQLDLSVHRADGRGRPLHWRTLRLAAPATQEAQ
ncbi:prepilin-type N-terminal cleavage/methylation domain-containing protein [Pseudoxanthomonas sangjuensis]|uniref:type II secretion system protein XpsI n=1 Tax=Pseudoxanthomonas sangjuensis TaxID=1503750 RepID=UPI001FE5C1E3|nr:type II secretion system protein [Pseudoxanthomonas sangjuensis]